MKRVKDTDEPEQFETYLDRYPVETGSGPGQPTKYRLEYCSLLADHLASGLSYKAFAGVVKVNLDTLYQWEKDNPEFSETKKRYWSAGLLKLEQLGIDAAEGKVEGFNATAWIFLMKNRFRWKDRTETKHKGEIKSTFDPGEVLALAKKLKSNEPE